MLRVSAMAPVSLDNALSTCRVLLLVVVVVVAVDNGCFLFVGGLLDASSSSSSDVGCFLFVGLGSPTVFLLLMVGGWAGCWWLVLVLVQLEVLTLWQVGGE